MLSKLARILAAQTPQSSPPPPRIPHDFRPISGYEAAWPAVQIPRAYRRSIGRPKPPEPLESFAFNMTRREKRRWQRAAADLGIPLSMMIRIAMRYFMGSNRMQQIIKAGPREVEFRKLVRADTLTRRLAKIIGPDDAEARATPPRQTGTEAPTLTPPPPPRARPEPAPSRQPRVMIVPRKIPRS